MGALAWLVSAPDVIAYACDYDRLGSCMLNVSFSNLNRLSSMQLRGQAKPLLPATRASFAHCSGRLAHQAYDRKVKGSFGHISTCVFSTHVITIAASHPCDTLSHHQSMQRDHSTSGSACSMVCTTGMRAQCQIQAQRLPSRYLMICSKLLCPCQRLVPPVVFFFSAAGGRDPRRGLCLLVLTISPARWP